MQNVMFTPSDNSEDVVASTLAKISRNILIFTFSVLPFFVVPLTYAPFGFSKVIFVVIGVLVAVIFYSLATLRLGHIEIKKSFLFLMPWLVALAAGVSAAFSGDVRDAFAGSDVSVHTAIFVALIALVTTSIPILGQKKNNLMTLYIALSGAALLLGMYHLSRLLFGADLLSFGLFTSSTSTPLGGWNDLAIFFGLALLLALVTIEQLPLTKIGQWIFIAISAIALIILSVVNFSAIWFVLGFVSLVVLMYSLTKHRFKGGSLQLDNDSSQKTVYSVILSTTVFVFSFAFIVGGSSLSAMISDATNISYVEVRPSFLATMDIARSVYKENAFTGTGPNKFADAWRLYKDVSINQTVFWNTAFNSGVGYIPTFVVTTGIVGVMTWLLFLFSILYAGLRILLSTTNVDRFWYFMGSSSFISAAYLWGIACLYVPSPAILLLASIFTGVLFTSYTATIPTKMFTVAFGNDKRNGFVLVALTMIVIIGSVSIMYFVSKQYSGQLAFRHALESVVPGSSIEKVEQDVISAYKLTHDSRFLREIASLQLSKMNTLLSVQSPTEIQAQQYQSALARAVESGELAVTIDGSESLNWQILAAIYNTAITSTEDEAYERTRKALEMAAGLDPKNPEIKLQFAQIESRTGNLDAAREYALEAIQLKNNYSEAYLFVAQIDIARGDVDSAIKSSSAIVALEPQNPARHYQLGILYASNTNLELAAASFERAIALNSSYANARYFLALTYSQLGHTDEAKKQLEFVRDLDPDNGIVNGLIDQLEKGESLGNVNGVYPIQNNETVSEQGTSLEGNNVPDSPLITPVNTVPERNAEENFLDENKSDVEVNELNATTTEE